MSDFDYKKGYYRLFLFARISILILAVALMITGQICIHRGEVIEWLESWFEWVKYFGNSCDKEYAKIIEKYL